MSFTFMFDEIPFTTAVVIQAGPSIACRNITRQNTDWFMSVLQ